MGSEILSDTTGSNPNNNIEIEPVYPEITAYADSHWDKDHRIVDGDYAGMVVGLCRPDASLGGRFKVTADSGGIDAFSRADIGAVQGLLDIAPTSGVVILDQEAKSKGGICIQGTDVHWTKMKAEALGQKHWYDPFASFGPVGWAANRKSPCKKSLEGVGNSEEAAAKKCEALIDTLHPKYVSEEVNSALLVAAAFTGLPLLGMGAHWLYGKLTKKDPPDGGSKTTGQDLETHVVESLLFDQFGRAVAARMDSIDWTTVGLGAAALGLAALTVATVVCPPAEAAAGAATASLWATFAARVGLAVVPLATAAVR